MRGQIAGFDTEGGEDTEIAGQHYTGQRHGRIERILLFLGGASTPAEDCQVGPLMDFDRS